MDKLIPIYTIFEAKYNRESDEFGLGSKCVISSYQTAEKAYASMQEIAKNQEKQGVIRVLENHPLNEGPMVFERFGDKFERWVVQEFLIVEG